MNTKNTVGCKIPPVHLGNKSSPAYWIASLKIKLFPVLSMARKDEQVTNLAVVAMSYRIFVLGVLNNDDYKKRHFVGSDGNRSLQKWQKTIIHGRPYSRMVLFYTNLENFIKIRTNKKTLLQKLLIPSEL